MGTITQEDTSELGVEVLSRIRTQMFVCMSYVVFTVCCLYAVPRIDLLASIVWEGESWILLCKILSLLERVDEAA